MGTISSYQSRKYSFYLCYCWWNRICFWSECNNHLADGNGTGATATATVTANVVTAITVTANGSGYTVPPIVTVAGGTGAEFIARTNAKFRAEPLVPMSSMNS